MAYGTISNEWLNKNNLETLWAAIVRDFVHAGANSSGSDGGTTKGSIPYWGEDSTPTGTGQPKQPLHLQIGSVGQFLGVANGVPVWVTPQIMQDSDSSTHELRLFLKDTGSVSPSVKLTLQAAGATAWGVVTDTTQTFGGDKTFKGHIKGEKNIEADWGVSAQGIADLTLGGGGGGGTVTAIAYGNVAVASQYEPVNGLITLPTNPSILNWNSDYQTLTSQQKTNLLNMYARVPSATFDSGNELADKAFVNSSIATSTATFRGTVTAADDTDAAAATALATITTKDDNDYAFVKVEGVPSAGVDKYKRYKWSGSAWVYEYTLNNSSFTQAQWNALNSGITTSLVSDIGTLKGYFNGDKAKKAIAADKFSSARTIELTGNVTGSASSDGESGWSISTTIANNAVTNAMLAGSITNSKLVNSTIYINGTTFTLGDNSTTNRLTAKWGTARNITISDADGSHSGTAVSVDGSEASTLLLPSTIKATFVGDITGDVTGNADTATTLETSRTLWGKSFNGSANISGDMSSVGDISFSASGKTIGGFVKFDTTNSRLGIGLGSSSPSEALDVNGKIKGTQLISTVATGTAPLAVTSTTKVTNLNADKLDGYEASGLFESMVNDNDQLKIQIGNTPKTLKLDYAKTTSRFKSDSSFTNQEFVYRQSPQTIDADSLVINKFKGRTLAWNQKFNWYSTSSVTSNVTVSVSNHEYTASGTISGVTYLYLSFQKYHSDGHIYYISFKVTPVDGTPTRIWAKADESMSGSFAREYSSTGRYSFLDDYKGSGSNLIIGATYASTGNSYTIKFSDIVLIDLTLMFGSGNEPATLEEFEALYPNAYYEYNAGQLINNSAEGLETVGFNLWDEEWRVGGYVDATGAASVDNRISSKNFIRCLPNTNYYAKFTPMTVTADDIKIFYYDANKNYLGTSNWTLSEFTTPENCYYIHFQLTTNYGTNYKYDTCINLSNPAKNGQYEPYRGNKLPLNLNSFKVKDSQGNIITITGGLKQAGSVRDEIVGGKYIRRVGSVDLGTLTWTRQASESAYGGYFFLADISNAKKGWMVNIICPKFTAINGLNPNKDNTISINITPSFCIQCSAYTSAADFKTAMSGVIAYYELATYETYELVSPIPTAMPAGTTERRLPEDTSDSVLAPFACDMTYGAQMADVLTIVPYADRVTRLATKRNLWGNWFDGTQDLLGDIHSEGNIQADYGVSAQGICDLALSAGGGSGTVTAVSVNGTSYYPDAGLITLPNYPSVSGLASETWVAQQISALNLGTASTHAHEDYVTGITWDSTNRKLKQTKGSNSATDIVQFGTVYSHAHSDYVTDLGVSGDTLTWSKGGAAQDAITVPYATTALDAKTELKQDQTITYRQTGGGILTKPYSSGVIKRVFGNTLVWNQRANLDMLSGGNTTRTKNATGFTSTAAAGSADKSCQFNGAFVANNHTFYLSFDYKSNLVYKLQDMNTARSMAVASSWTHSSKIGVCTNSSYTPLYWYLYSTTTESWNLEVKNVTIIDLTLFFNGNIPENLTPSEFEQKYNISGFYEPNAGTLINNACSGLESVGFNLWDEEVFKGTFSSVDGETPTAMADFLATQNKIPVIAGKSYYLKSPNTFRLFYYDASKAFISSTTNISPNTAFTMPSGVCYVRFQMGYQTNYNNDICINISNPSRNGTYEPYRKNTLPFNLNSFRVKDSQGNIITITGGLKQAGSVRDEIVGNKFIQRVGSVDLATLTWSAAGAYETKSWGAALPHKKGTNAIAEKYISSDLDGSTIANYIGYITLNDNENRIYVGNYNQPSPTGMLNYELATPIEYEMIDDFPTSYPIDVLGTESIPEGELVAPFIGDIQYGAKQNDFAWDIDHISTRLAGIDISHYKSGQSSPVDTHVIKVGDKLLYLKFSAVNGSGSVSGALPSFTLEVSDKADDTGNSQSFTFGTMSESEINSICHL
jgi:hypothetical protein